ncbi:MAG: hypothetical protein U1A73_13020 [Pseudomonas sp.]|nr:hypothetical protein [Pseudomonas sp.]
MLRLDDPQWANLRHAYGTAENIPPLLSQLSSLPSDIGDAEPWFTIWSSLAHQGDVYPASFASVPHIIATLAANPSSAPAAFFHFPAWVEICRHRASFEVPAPLAEPYFAALRQLPGIVAAAASPGGWSHEQSQCTLACLAVAQGQHAMAEALLELSPEVLADFVVWLDQR